MLLLASVHTGNVKQVQGSPCGQGSLYCSPCNYKKNWSLLLRKGPLIYFFCCFLKLLISLGCLGTKWDEGVMCGSHSFYVTSQIEKGPLVYGQHTWHGCISPLASPIPTSTKPLLHGAAHPQHRGGDGTCRHCMGS